MPSDRSILERQIERVELGPFTLERFHRRRSRKQRNRRIGAAVVALAVAAGGIGGLVRTFSSGLVPAGDPRSPFLGTWVTTDGDGSTLTMSIRASGDGAVEFVVHDDAASVCSGAPATMTGTGRLEGSNELVIPSPVLTCDDGSEPEAPSGLPLEEQLRNLTFVHAETDALTDNFGSVWERVPGEDPSPEPTMSGGMWPQSSLEEVRETQRLADAGDRRYSWQVDPELAAEADPGDAEIFARFLREELGWEEFRWGVGGGDLYGAGEGTYEVVFARCAPGRTNPLYPNDPASRGCAPTIDEFRYETVKVSVAQLVRRSPSGIWVVTRWAVLPPSAVPVAHLYPDFFQRQVEQVAPPSDAEATALLRAFLRARVDGEGAREFLHVPEDGEIPLLYATSSGAPYERSEIELVEGPVWPAGWMQFKVRLFAEDGETVVEQFFFLDREETGRLGLEYWGAETGIATTENGQAVPEPYSILDGEVTFGAAPPWEPSWAGWDHGPTWTTLISANHHPEERVEVLADPLPIGTGCREGPAPADAEALARSIRSDPELEATSPVAVRVGGIEALRMDVVAATGASVCDVAGTPLVLTETGLDRGHRMRLYLLDLPGGSARILAIAIVAPEPRFERVVDAAAPIVDSFEFRTR
jgi:hypothetical protein